MMLCCAISVNTELDIQGRHTSWLYFSSKKLKMIHPAGTLKDFSTLQPNKIALTM